MHDAGEEVGVALATHGADKVNFGKLRNQLHGEFPAVPAVNGDRPYLARQEGSDFGQPVLLFGAQKLLKGEEVPVGVGKAVDVDFCCGHGVPSRWAAASDVCY